MDSRGGGGRRSGGSRDRMQKRHEQYIEWLEKNYPAEAAELAEVREKNPQLYIRKLTQSMKKYGKIAFASKEHPEMAKVLKENLELKELQHKLIEEYKTADADQKEIIKAELTDALSKRFDLIIRQKQLKNEILLKKLEELKKHVKKSEAEVANWQKNKPQQVESQVEELLKETEKFKWD